MFSSGDSTSKWSPLSLLSQPIQESQSDFPIPLNSFLRPDIGAAESAITDEEYFSGPNYLQLSAQEKQAQLWAKVLSNTKETGQWPGARIGELFLIDMRPTFDTPGDVMPKADWWPHPKRKKYIHSVGVSGKVKLVPSGIAHPFTGIFKGADFGIARLSVGAKPSAKQPLVVGMGLKFLRSGVDSANLVAMFSGDGTPGDWNFFGKDFKMRIEGPEDKGLQALEARMSMLTKLNRQVGLSDMAMLDQNGKPDATTFPFELRFEPHTDVNTLFPKELQNNDYSAYMPQLQSIKANTNIFNVYGMDHPNGKEYNIGILQLDGQFTQSKWGDENLQFRHQRYDEDVKFHPDWVNHIYTYDGPFKAPKNGVGMFSTEEKKSGCPFLQ